MHRACLLTILTLIPASVLGQIPTPEIEPSVSEAPVYSLEALALVRAEQAGPLARFTESAPLEPKAIPAFQQRRRSNAVKGMIIGGIGGAVLGGYMGAVGYESDKDAGIESNYSKTEEIVNGGLAGALVGGLLGLLVGGILDLG